MKSYAIFLESLTLMAVKCDPGTASTLVAMSSCYYFDGDTPGQAVLKALCGHDELKIPGARFESLGEWVEVRNDGIYFHGFDPDTLVAPSCSIRSRSQRPLALTA